ncbi:Hypothetical predicted protein [Mytilus galloprovincialis]|uniref:Uncharacterized protein n=1 Tax=Mytilus galloprovincialis TaxID=29158 RepID=A0A8B6GW02_MYTGA|nr:Hypothetical predicted protein [Mytilus galloprovincialis]
MDVTLSPLFVERKKQSAGQTWEIFDDVIEVFWRLSKKPALVMYDRPTPFDINESRLELFVRKQRQYGTIAPTRAALLGHTKRAEHQGYHVSGQAVTYNQRLPSPGD